MHEIPPCTLNSFTCLAKLSGLVRVCHCFFVEKKFILKTQERLTCFHFLQPHRLIGNRGQYLFWIISFSEGMEYDCCVCMITTYLSNMTQHLKSSCFFFIFHSSILLWLCNWLSLRRLVSWNNHMPPACWSTFWKSIFKQIQMLDCRFDIMDSLPSVCCVLTYAIIYVLIHHIIFRHNLSFLNDLYFFKYSCFNINHRHCLFAVYFMLCTAICDTRHKYIFQNLRP